jgi:hypothetical protein
MAAVTTPTFAQAPGTYNGFVKVTINSVYNDGCTGVYFTTDGTIPSPTNFTGCFAPGNYVYIAATTTLKAMVVHWYYSPMGNSDVASGVYTITPTGSACATPTVSVAAGTYATAQTVTLSCSTPGTTIRYTINGTYPTETNGTVYASPLLLAGTGPLQAVAYLAGWNDSAVASAAYNITSIEQSPSPTFVPSAYTFGAASSSFSFASLNYSGGYGYAGLGWSAVSSLIACVLAPLQGNFLIIFTLDGSSPSESHGTYDSGGQNTNTGCTTAQAIAFQTPYYSDSTVCRLCAQPTSSVNPGTYTSIQNIVLSCNTAGATIVYTTDGSTPTPTNGTVYTTPIVLSIACTLKAIAYANGYTTSAVSSGAYSYNICATPTFSPIPGTYPSELYVNLACTTPGVTLRYTIDGTIPTETTGLLYGSYIDVTVPTTIKAIAYKTGWGDSTVAVGVFAMTCGTPVIMSSDPWTNYLTSLSTITITDSVPGSTIKYTLDGSTPSETNGMVYAGSFTINNSATYSVTISAMAFKTGYVDSAVTSRTEIFACASPTYLPNPPLYFPGSNPPYAPGPYPPGVPITVTISTVTPGATINYIVMPNSAYSWVGNNGGWGFWSPGETLANDTPTATFGTAYATPVSILPTTKIVAVAFAPNRLISPTSQDVWILKTPCATPTFSPSPGTYALAQTVTISDTTTGATIRYTLDGSTPTETNGTMYTTPISITQTTTLQAIAYLSSWTDSIVVIGIYTIEALDHSITGLMDATGELHVVYQGTDGNLHYQYALPTWQGALSTQVKIATAGVGVAPAVNMRFLDAIDRQERGWHPYLTYQTSAGTQYLYLTDRVWGTQPQLPQPSPWRPKAANEIETVPWAEHMVVTQSGGYLYWDFGDGKGARKMFAIPSSSPPAIVDTGCCTLVLYLNAGGNVVRTYTENYGKTWTTL